MAWKPHAGQHAAHEGPGDVADAADDGQHHQGEADEDEVRVRIDRDRGRRHEDAAEPGDGGREHEDRQLQLDQVLAERGCRRRAVLHGGQPPSVGTVAEGDQPDPDHGEDDGHRGQEGLGCGQIERADLDLGNVQRPVGEDREVGVEDGQDVRVDVPDDHVGDEHPEGQRGQGQVEPSQPEGGQGDQPTDHPRRGYPDQNAPQRDPRVETYAGQPQVEDEDGGDGPEGHRGQVDLPGIAGEQRQGQGDDGEGHPDGQGRDRLGGHDLLEQQDGGEQDGRPEAGRSEARDLEALAAAQERRPADGPGAARTGLRTARSSAARSGSWTPTPRWSGK